MFSRSRTLVLTAFSVLVAVAAVQAGPLAKAKKLHKIFQNPGVAFRHMDANGDGTVDPKEWGGAHEHIKGVIGPLIRHLRKSGGEGKPGHHIRKLRHMARKERRAAMKGRGKPGGPRKHLLAFRMLNKIHDTMIKVMGKKAALLKELGDTKEAIEVADAIVAAEGHFLTAIMAAHGGNKGLALSEVRAIYQSPWDQRYQRLQDKQKLLDGLMHRRRMAAIKLGRLAGEKRVLGEEIKRVAAEFKAMKKDLVGKEKN